MMWCAIWRWVAISWRGANYKMLCINFTRLWVSIVTLIISYIAPFSTLIVILVKTAFHLLEGDPSNYLTYFKRGTVYFALGKAKLAVIDFNKVLELKPDFTGVSTAASFDWPTVIVLSMSTWCLSCFPQARNQRAHILLKQGNLEEAKADFLHIVSWEVRISLGFLNLSGFLAPFEIYVLTSLPLVPVPARKQWRSL